MTFLNTLLLIAGLIPTAMQTVAARYSAVYSAQSRQAGIIQIWRYGVRRGWVVGLGIAITIMLLAPLISDLFQLRDAFLLLPIALAIPFFMATGTERGILQGKEKYYWLAAVYLIEAIIRLGLGVVLALLLVNANRSLDGAVWALMQSLVLTWFVAWFALRYFSGSSIADTSNIPEIEKQQWMKLFGFTAMALFGQALITNSDFILVKSYFDSFDAGLYAAISVIGRIVYFGTMPLTVVMIPLIAKQQALGKSTRNMLFILIGSGFALCSGLILVSALFASNIVEIMYGTDYLSAAYLLPLYTISAALFVMTNLLVTYRVALGKGSETWMPLFAGVAQIFGVILFHDTLQTVIIVQIIIMTALFGGVTWQMRR